MLVFVRYVEASKLRRMCIEHNYYSLGCNEDYGLMLLKYEGQPVTEAEIEWLAEDIKSHSDTEDTVVSIAYNILTEACYDFVDEIES